MAEFVGEVVDGIGVDVDGDVGTVWLARPEHGNTFTSAMQNELHRALDRLDRDDTVRVIIVTGQGRLFSAGAGMEAGGDNFAFDEEQYRRAQAEMSGRPRPWQMRTPIIGALNGSAVGLGLTFPLQWDIRIVNEDAKYGFVFTRRGLTPEQNSLWLLPRMVGAGTAVELLLTGRVFNGSEAKDLGIATEAVPADSVLPRAREIARDIAANTAPAAVGVTKELIYEMLQDGDREAAFAREWQILRWMGRHSDSNEGVESFLARRPAQFSGAKSVDVPDTAPGWGS